MTHSITTKITLSVSCIFFLLAPTTALADKWHVNDHENYFTVKIEEDLLTFSFTFSNGQHINQSLVPARLHKISDSCFIGTNVTASYFNEKFNLVLCRDKTSLVWAKTTAEDIFLIPNWLRLEKKLNSSKQ